MNAVVSIISVIGYLAAVCGLAYFLPFGITAIVCSVIDKRDKE